MGYQDFDLTAVENAITQSQTPNGGHQAVYFDENTGNLNLTGGVKTTKMVQDGYASSRV